MTTGRAFYALFSAFKQNAVKLKVPEFALVPVGMRSAITFKASSMY